MVSAIAHNETGSIASEVKLPRSMKLKKEFLLSQAAQPLWTQPINVGDDEELTFPPAFWFVAAHGGAGCTTLSALLAPAGDAGQLWPVYDDFPLCVVVARATMLGLERAHQVLLQGLQSIDEVKILGAVVINDAPGKLPTEIRHKLEVLAPLAKIWQVDYLPSLRVLLPQAVASWRPGDDLDTTRKGRKLSVTEQVPLTVATVGEEIFAAAHAALDTSGKE